MVQGQIAAEVEPHDYEEIDVSTSAIGLTLAKLTANDVALVRFEGGAVRYRVDGVDPTSSVGLPGFDGNTVQLYSLEKVKFRAIRLGSTDGKLRVVYYKHHCRR